MRAGKSTLIHALLGEKQIPVMQEACIAAITERHDRDDLLVAFVYDVSKEGHLLSACYEKLQLK